jgi:hypothetical protein
MRKYVDLPPRDKVRGKSSTINSCTIGIRLLLNEVDCILGGLDREAQKHLDEFINCKRTSVPSLTKTNDEPFTPPLRPFKLSLSHRRNSRDGSCRGSSSFVRTFLPFGGSEIRLVTLAVLDERVDVNPVAVGRVLAGLLAGDDAVPGAAFPLEPTVVQPL